MSTGNENELVQKFWTNYKWKYTPTQKFHFTKPSIFDFVILIFCHFRRQEVKKKKETEHSDMHFAGGNIGFILMRRVRELNRTDVHTCHLL